MTIQQQIILEIVGRFPKASNLAVAKIAHRDNPSVFKSVESARERVKAYRNGTGTSKKLLASTTFEAGSNHLSRTRLPKGETFFEDWSPLIVEGKTNSLVLSDAHIPYHDRRAVEESVRYGKGNGVDTVLLNGDFADFFSVSFWQKDPRKRNFPREVKTVIAGLKWIREEFPKARILYKLGNHEERYIRYMETQAPVLLGIDAFEIKSLFKFDDLGIELVEDKRPIQLGELNVIHGHEYKFAISNPVNPARGLFLRCKAYALCGHFHQSSYHTAKTVEQNTIATWSTGCLCDLHPDYMPMNDWCHGFARVEVDNRGKFNIDHKVIHNGKTY